MALPLSLVHPILGEFTDDTENHVPMPDDVLAFVEAMANVYNAEDGRKDTVLSIFENYKTYINPTLIGKFGTSGDLSSGEFRFSNSRTKSGPQPLSRFFKPSSITSRKRGNLPVNIVTPFYHA